MSIQALCRFLIEFFIFCYCMSFLYIHHSLDIRSANIFSHSIGWLPFHFVDGFLSCVEDFYFDIIQVVYFGPVAFAFGQISQNSLPRLTSRCLLSMLSPRSFTASGLTCNFFSWFFVCCVRKESSLILFHVTALFSQQHLFKSLSSCHCESLALLL